VTATTTYGPIADWNTAAVTSMASLFYPTVAPSTSGTAQPKFNGDISKWNVASVSNMFEVRLDSVWTAHSFSYVSLSQSKLKPSSQPPASRGAAGSNQTLLTWASVLIIGRNLTWPMTTGDLEQGASSPTTVA
jgi:surface protein